MGEGSGKYSFGEVFTIVGAVITGVLWLTTQINTVRSDIQQVESVMVSEERFKATQGKWNTQFGQLEEKVHDVDRRLSIVEGWAQ